jgi:hypothetical protein
MWEMLAFIGGLFLGAILRRKNVKYVVETESQTTTRIRELCKGQIEWRKKRLLSAGCGWSEGDELRRGIEYYEDILDILPEEVGAIHD